MPLWIPIVGQYLCPYCGAVIDVMVNMNPMPGTPTLVPASMTCYCELAGVMWAEKDSDLQIEDE